MNQHCSIEYFGNLRKLEVVKMEEKHFFAVHTFVSDEVRSQFVTPPEKRNPPEKRETEKEWVENDFYISDEQVKNIIKG